MPERLVYVDETEIDQRLYREVNKGAVIVLDNATPYIKSILPGLAESQKYRLGVIAIHQFKLVSYSI